MTKRARLTVSLAICLAAGCGTNLPGAGDDGVPPDDGRPRPDGPDGPDGGVDAADAGPDGGPSELDVFQSGSRLKMRVATTIDGAKTFLGWRDTMRNEDCGFAL